jgi:serine/threonine protein kinase
LVVVALVSSLLACCFIGQCWWCKTRKTRKEIKLRKKYFNGKLQEHIINQEEAEKTKLFTEKEVKKSTENFNEDRIIGKGGQGTVYKGMLSDGKLVAVKKSISLGETQWKELISEVLILSNVNHRNVVKLLGCCLETQSLLLVYEFIPNGTLSELIHSPNEEFQLTWDTRLRIASEVAGAIAYLHSSCSSPIYHRDIKTNNILLDHEYRAKVCDFGISRSTSTDQTHITTFVRGTFGYLDPEYFRSSQFTEKSDVYSFGVVLVEMVTGKKPIIVTSDYATSLVTEFMSLTDDSAIFGMLDPVILRGSDNVIDDIMVVVNLAKGCLNPIGVERPTMMQVAMELACLKQKEIAKSTSFKDKSSTSEHA